MNTVVVFFMLITSIALISSITLIIGYCKGYDNGYDEGFDYGQRLQKIEDEISIFSKNE